MSQFEILLCIQTLIFYGPFFLVGLIQRFAPPKINKWYGFRTQRALKNEKNWYYAQAEASKFILIITPVFLVISLLIKYLTDFNYQAFVLYSIIDILLLIIETVMIFLLTEDGLREGIPQ